MQPENFKLIHKNTELDVISIEGCKTMILVYPYFPSNDPNINTGEIYFYASNHGKQIVFETVAWEDTKLEHITAAMTWYGHQEGNEISDVSIHPPGVKLRVIK